MAVENEVFLYYYFDEKENVTRRCPLHEVRVRISPAYDYQPVYSTCQCLYTVLAWSSRDEYVHGEYSESYGEEIEESSTL